MPSASHIVIDSAIPDNSAPVASFIYAKNNLQVATDATASSDPDGTIVSYAWTFGDGATATGVNPYHTYAATGTYVITLVVTDNDATTDSTSQSVSVTAAVATFTLGTTKPLGTSLSSSDGNAGTGVIRSVPTGSAGTRSGAQSVASGATLQGFTINGDVTVASGGQLLDCIVNGRVVLSGTGALVENCEIQGDGSGYSTDIQLIGCQATSGTRNTVQYNRIHGTVASKYVNGLGYYSMDIFRNDIFNIVDGVDNNGSKGVANSNIQVRGNHFHDFMSIYDASRTDDRTHNDGVQSQGGVVLVEGNYFEMTPSSLSTADQSQKLDMVGYMANHTQAVEQPTLKNNWYSDGSLLMNFLDENTYPNGSTYAGMVISITGNRFDLTNTTYGNNGICQITNSAKSTINLTWSGNTNQSAATIAGPLYV